MLELCFDKAMLTMMMIIPADSSVAATRHSWQVGN